MKKLLVLLLGLALVFTFAACGAGEEPAEESAEPAEEQAAEEVHEPVTIMLAAAASLETAFKDTLIPMFQEQYDYITVEGTYGSSGDLQTQIESGLDAQVFMSAANKQMNALADEGLVNKDDIVQLLVNKVVLISGKDYAGSVTGFENINEANTIALGDPASVPVGQYAQEIFENLGLWDELSGGSKVSWGENVTQVLSWVAEGSAEVGVVYATDAAKADYTDKVVVLSEAPEGMLKTPVIYPVATLAAAADNEAAQLFVEFLQSDEAIKVFEGYGFSSNL